MKRFFTRLRHELWCYDSVVLPSKVTQGGFLLLSLLAIMIVLSASFLGLSRYQEENRRWQVYYAFGQQLAITAQALHAGVQLEAFAPGTTPQTTKAEQKLRPVNKKFNDPSITMADHFWDYGAKGVVTGLSVNSITAQNYGLDYRNPAALHVAHFEVYAGLAPIGAPDADLAPSAYLIVRMKPVAGYGILAQRGRDLAATRAGALSKGLSAFAVVNYSSSSALLCRGAPAVARWSADDYGCLTSADLVGFNDGDIVIATWQSQPKNLAANDVIYRYPQPGNPSFNRMATNLLLNDNDGNTEDDNIINVGEMQTSKLAVDTDATIGEDANSQALTVQGATNLQGRMQVAKNLLVGTKLDVSGDLVLANDARIGESINVDNGNGIVGAKNVSANTLGENGRDLILGGPNGASTKVSIKEDVDTKDMWVDNNLNAAQSGKKVKAASLGTTTLKATVTVADTARARDMLTTPSLSVASSSQLPSAVATGKCSGQACPDNVDGNPGGGL